VAGGALAIMLALPVAVWNWTHDWASFAKQFGRVVRGNTYVQYLFEFIGAYVALATHHCELALAGSWRVTRSVLAARDQHVSACRRHPTFAGVLFAAALHNPVQTELDGPLYPFCNLRALAVDEISPDGRRTP